MLSTPHFLSEMIIHTLIMHEKISLVHMFSYLT